MLCLPEIRLKRICDSLLKYVEDDYNRCLEKGKENSSYIYLLFHQDEEDKNNSVLYETAKAIFINYREDII